MKQDRESEPSVGAENSADSRGLPIGKILAVGGLGVGLGAGAVLGAPYVEQFANIVKEEIQSLRGPIEMTREDMLKLVIGLSDDEVADILAMEPEFGMVYDAALAWGSGQITFNNHSLTTKAEVDDLIRSDLLFPYRRKDSTQPLLFNIPEGAVASVDVVENDPRLTWGRGVMNIRFDTPFGDSLMFTTYISMFSELGAVVAKEDAIRNAIQAEQALNDALSTTTLAINLNPGGEMLFGTSRDSSAQVTGTDFITQNYLSGLMSSQCLKENYKHSPAILSEWVKRVDSTNDGSTLLRDNPLYYISRTANLDTLEAQGVSVGHDSRYGDEPRLMLPPGTYNLEVKRVGAVDQLVITIDGAQLAVPIYASDTLAMLDGQHTAYFDAHGHVTFTPESPSDSRPVEYPAAPLPPVRGSTW